MSETIIISNLHRDDFVASANSQLSLANHIKLAILNLPPPPGEPEYAHNISHYSELAFLSRIIIIFKSHAAAASAYDFLSSLQKSTDSTKSENSSQLSERTQRFSLPSTAKLSLQENLLSHSRSSDNLEEASELSVRDDLERFRSKHSGSLPDYEEPAPEKLDMYQDLLKSGIDISKFNTEAEVKEFEENQKRGDTGAFSRRKSVTKTLFKPTPLLSVATDPKAVSNIPPPSPIITLDETF